MIEVRGSRRSALLQAVFRNQRSVLSGSRQTLRIVMSGAVKTGDEGRPRIEHCMGLEL
jgi:hypothetical protein